MNNIKEIRCYLEGSMSSLGREDLNEFMLGYKQAIENVLAHVKRVEERIRNEENSMDNRLKRLGY